MIETFEGKEIRFIYKDNTKRWVASDICEILDVNTSEVVNGRPGRLSGLPENERSKELVPTIGGMQKLWTVNEDGFKRIILKSKKPVAKRLAEAMNIEVLMCSKEQEVMETLLLSFAHLNPVPQFFINGYFIDLYRDRRKTPVFQAGDIRRVNGGTELTNKCLCV